MALSVFVKPTNRIDGDVHGRTLWIDREAIVRPNRHEEQSIGSRARRHDQRHRRSGLTRLHEIEGGRGGRVCTEHTNKIDTGCVPAAPMPGI